MVNFSNTSIGITLEFMTIYFGFYFFFVKLR